jgi:Zn-dependent protease
MLSNLSGIDLLTVLVSLIISLAIHEAMHGFVAHWLGDDTAKHEGRLTLNPLAHIDPVMTILMPIITLALFQVPFLAAKPVPFNPMRVKFEEFGGALVAIAGPATNLVLAVLAALAFGLATPGTYISDALRIFTQLNVVIFVFNMIPIPPLDGSRVLYAFAPEPLQRFMESIEPFGLPIIFALIFIANLGSFIGNISDKILQFLG